MTAKTENKNTQAVEKKSDGPVTIWTILQDPDNKAKLQNALSNALPLEQFLSVAATSIQRNPQLLQCHPMSVYRSIRDAATYGLFPNSVTNEGHLVPYKKECQFIVGYKGLLKLAWESEVITGVDVQPIYENDTFRYHYGLNPDLTHIPATGDRGGFIGAYAVVRIKGGDPAFKVLLKEDAEKHRDKFAKAKNGPWKDHFEAMTMKTVLRMAMKYTPVTSKSQKLHTVIHEDERHEAGVYGGVVDHDPINMPERESEDNGDGEVIDPETGEITEGQAQQGEFCPACNGSTVDPEAAPDDPFPCGKCDGTGIVPVGA